MKNNPAVNRFKSSNKKNYYYQIEVQKFVAKNLSKNELFMCNIERNLKFPEKTSTALLNFVLNSIELIYNYTSSPEICQDFRNN